MNESNLDPRAFSLTESFQVLVSGEKRKIHCPGIEVGMRVVNELGDGPLGKRL